MNNSNDNMSVQDKYRQLVNNIYQLERASAELRACLADIAKERDSLASELARIDALIELGGNISYDGE